MASTRFPLFSSERVPVPSPLSSFSCPPDRVFPIQLSDLRFTTHLIVSKFFLQIKWRLADDPIEEDEADEWKDPALRARHRCTIFLGYFLSL